MTRRAHDLEGTRPIVVHLSRCSHSLLVPVLDPIAIAANTSTRGQVADSEDFPIGEPSAKNDRCPVRTTLLDAAKKQFDALFSNAQP
jgi:hypothetical protein